jgi:predicted dehydrogenase
MRMKPRSRPVTRRTFLQSPLAAALAVSACPRFLSAATLGRGPGGSPNARVQVAAIGVGPQGQGVMSGILAVPQARVTAVCDVFLRHRNQARDRVHRHDGDTACTTYHDFRQVLERPDIDAVLIATPDHWHVPVAIAAARAGKDIYLEKPMGLAVAENQLLRAAVRQHQRIFQFGTQQRSSREFQRAIELVRNGRIGALKEIHVWAPASQPGGSMDPSPVPEGLDYDFWLGPAPRTPYTDGKAVENPATQSWKTWWFHADYALGFIAGWGVHPLDIALWGHPPLVEGIASIEGRGHIPTQGAGNTAVAWDVQLTAADGVKLHYRGTPNGFSGKHELHDLSPWEKRYGPLEGHGTAFLGSDGWVQVHRGGLRTHPAALAESPSAGAFSARPSDSHPQDWISSILTRRPAVCEIETAFHADLLCHLSDLAVRNPRPLRFDFRREQFLDDPVATRQLALRPMRTPWTL